MTKKAKVFSIVSGMILVAGAAFCGTYLVFKYTPVAEMVIPQLHTKVEAEVDQEILDRIDSKNIQKTQASSDTNTLKQENETLAAVEKTKIEEVKAKQEKLQQQKAVTKKLPKDSSTEIRAKRDSAKRRYLAAQIKNIEVVGPILEQMREQIDAVLRAALELETRQAAVETLHRDVEAKILAFREALSTRSNWKEFFLYIFGLKLLWGIFTGYARTFYPYSESAQLQEARKTLKESSPALMSSLEEAQEKLKQETQVLKSIFKRAETSLAFNTKAQALFVAKVKVPLSEILDAFQTAATEQLRTQEVVREFIDSYWESKGYVPYFNPSKEPYYSREGWESARRKKVYKVSEEAKSAMKSLHEELKTLLADSSQYLRMFTFDVLAKVNLIQELSSLETTKKTSSRKMSR